MATHSLATLHQLWKQGKLTDQQMLGHLLQHLEAQEAQMKALQQEVRALQQAAKA